MLISLLTLAVLLSFMVGARTTAPAQVWHGLVHRDESEVSLLVWDYRLPRTVAAIVVGAALGVAGALMQAFSRNPLADPGILGVNAGAAFTVTVGFALFGLSSQSAALWLALPGALLATGAVYLMGSGGRGPASPLRLTLAGVALGAVLSGVATGIRLSDPRAFEFMLAWAAGSVAGRDLQQTMTVVPLIGCGLIAAMLLARSLNLIALGDDVAATMGTPVPLVRVLTILAVTVLAGAATALAGPISLAGLIVPHIVRWSVGPDQGWIIGLTMLAAPVLVLMSDILARVALDSGELPISVVTAFVGAPLLIALVLRRKASGL